MAGRKGHIPKFREFEANNATPYTVMFDIARGDKAPKDAGSNKDLSEAGPKRVAPVAEARQKKQYDCEGEFHKKDHSPRSASIEPVSRPRPGAGGNSGGRGSPDILRTSSDDPPERRNPYHKVNPSNGIDKSVSQPARVGRASGRQGSAVAEDGASKGRARPEEIYERGDGGHLPKFGEWNTDDTDAGANYTIIFDKASKDRNSGSARVPVLRSGLPGQNQDLHSTRNIAKKHTHFLCCIAPSAEE